MALGPGRDGPFERLIYTALRGEGTKMNLEYRWLMNLLAVFKIALCFSLFVATPLAAFADVCVWRDPERTMSKLFPEAQDYSTITIKLTPEHVARIEKRLGAPLDESEKHEFNFYELKSKQGGKVVTLGHAVALGGKGEYGVIEVVIGVDPSRKIRAAYIQRSSERAKKEIESPAFLSQFKGKSFSDSFEFGKDIKSPPTATVAGNVVRITIRKMLAFYEELLPKQE